jgi:hypothetical protein
MLEYGRGKTRGRLFHRITGDTTCVVLGIALIGTVSFCSILILFQHFLG